MSIAPAVTTAVTPAQAGLTGWAWLLVALPALGAALLLIGGKATNSFGPLLATALSWASFLLGAALLVDMLGRPAEQRAVSVDLWNWISAGTFSLNAGLLVDQLSISFVLLITFVGSLIHIYSLGYMAHDPDKRKFFAFLNLFVAAMLTLVLANSYTLMFLGWEGVGLASYLLIGFWNWNPPYASAANKAFIANRFGDVGMVIAMMIILTTFGNLDFATVFTGVEKANEGTLTAIGLFLLLGACAKSAQFPLQSWLGDAMAGPTPVSALIHAATMVTAGVYLIVRSHPIFNSAPTAQTFVIAVGAITLTMGAIIGCAKDDIKKALAASTMSQIGYMMLAAGLGPIGYSFAIFHLITHGFFKAGMFLGAGSVMHGMSDRVDMRTFGELAGQMRTTWITFLCGWLAIIGFPLLSGYWSKDKIIEAAFIGEGIRPWIIGPLVVLVAGLTAFYMSRLFFMTFHGRKRWLKDDHPHESPATMTVPMVILAIGSVFLGGALTFFGFPHWLEPVVGAHGAEHHPVLPVPVITGITLVCVAVGVFLAWRDYAKKDVPVTAPEGNLLIKIASNDFYQDSVNDLVLVGPGNAVVKGATGTDEIVISGGANGIGAGLAGLSGVVARLQNGYARSYALMMLSGVVAILAAVLVVL
ncbi:NADH-quinone oxidoreductase subunit L [Dermatophilus congolensis]|nr:NADH-quinone oxidoreductase subunit L [Dermatophilus congolensis]MBO3152220.1 NADH-quinone oxidoreductase subunit L [Dermatophilus congolensis]MBO3160767.1 NADH-quinone oxidoreductase subunit L [Dermatophilus congolensis]MBO3163511.1 NADH-quinone oxidoreductase subunit L [Dermatophilus congolensis]MBO3177057.1 NADH-quinone oxidoreductase subunit L [Dermatophilus congolensis]